MRRICSAPVLVLLGLLLVIVSPFALEGKWTLTYQASIKQEPTPPLEF